MARAFILSPKLSDAGALTASNSVGGAGASNLQTARPEEYWRSSSNTPILEGQLITPQLNPEGLSQTAVDTMMLGFVNPGGTFRLALASDAALLGTPDLYDSGVLAVQSNGDLYEYALTHRVHTFAPVYSAAIFYRITFNYAITIAQYVQAARLMLGLRVEPAVSVRPGWAMGHEEVVAETVDLGGGESPRIMGAKRNLSVTWPHLTQSEQSQMANILLERGSARDIALVIDSAEEAFSMQRIAIGRVKQAVTIPQTFNTEGTVAGANFALNLTVAEMAPIDMV